MKSLAGAAPDPTAAGEPLRVPSRLRRYQPRPRLRFLTNSAESVPDLDLLLRLEHGQLGRRRLWQAALGSALLHLAVILGVLSLPPGRIIQPERTQIALRFRDPTTLVAPPPELLRQLTGRPELTLEQLIRGPGAPPRAFELPPAPPEPALPPSGPPPLIEPPKLGPLGKGPAPSPEPPFPSALADAAAPPQIQPSQERPKLAFESVGPGGFSSSAATPATGLRPGGAPSGIQRPPASIEQVIEEVVRSGGGSKGLVIGDIELPGGIVEARSIPPSPGNAGSNIELLSDPRGVDFRPYLIRVLSAVRRNWLVVMPESARLGRRGKVVIQFAINRSGHVPKLVIAVPSGAEALDRAAVAGISASNPFPPLPPEFTGDEIRLQLNFLYNIKR